MSGFSNPTHWETSRKSRLSTRFNLAANFSEDTITADQTSSGAMTPQEAQAEINKLTAPGTAYWDKLHPNHQQAVDEVFALRQMAHPDLTEQSKL